MPSLFQKAIGRVYAVWVAPLAIIELANADNRLQTLYQARSNAMDSLLRGARQTNDVIAKLASRVSQGEKERKATREADREFGRQFADVRTRLAAVETKLATTAGTFTVDAKGFDILSKRIDDIQLYGPK